MMKHAALVLTIVLSAAPLLANEQDTRELAPEDLKPYTEHIPKTLTKFDMVPIKGGKMLFSEDGKKEPTEVEIKPFWMAKTECTWREYETFYLQLDLPEKERRLTKDADGIGRPSPPHGTPDHSWGRDGYPVLHTSYHAGMKYCEWLSQKTGKKYRMPTEVEWEYACRAGEPGPAQKLDKDKVLEMAWVKENSENDEHHKDNTTHPVATKKPNAFGLYDMLGNVGEWCTQASGKERILRGGTYMDKAAIISPTLRVPFNPEWQAQDSQDPKSKWWMSDGPFCGFRVVREP
jgi:formylglycine-generating enzyme required for sulfatase activity